MKKKTRVSSIFLTLLFSLLLLVNSCSNIFDNDISEIYEQTKQEDKASDDDGSDNQNPGGQAAAPAKRYATLTGNIGLNGAYPLQVRNDVENTHVAPDTSLLTNANQTNRSAIPALPGGFQFFIKAVYRDSLNQEHEVNGNVNDDRSYVITLELDVEYELISGIKYNYGGNIGEKTLLEDRKPNVVLSDTQASFNYNFILKPLTTGGNGKIELTMTVPASITAARAECISEDETIKNQWNTAVEVYENNHTELVNVSGTTATLNLDEIKSGCYEIAFSFLNQAGGYSLYSTVQTINVFENMITETWTNGGNDELISNSGVFAINQALLVKYSHQNIYVGNTGVAAPNDDESKNAGTAYSPFGDFNKALDLIAAENIATNDYTIHVYGTQYVTQSGNFSLPDTLDDKINSITIIGETRMDEQNTPVEPVLSGAGGSGTVLTVNTTKPVKLKNIKITGGNADNGAGLKVLGGAQVTLDNGTFITGNTASGLGSGVYVEGEDSSHTTKSTLYMRGTARIALTDDVYLADGNKIKVSGTLTSSGQVAKITPIDWTRGRVVLEASNTNLLLNSLNKFAMQDSEFHIEQSSGNIADSSKGVLNAPIYLASQGEDSTRIGTASNSSNTRGTRSYPVSTMASALSLVNSSNTIITIDGTLTGKQEISGIINADEITIIGRIAEGASTSAATLNGAYTTEEELGCTLLINTNKKVTIQHLTITGGKNDTTASSNTSSSYSGGGISVIPIDANVVIGTGTVITDNSAKIGGGIAFNGTLTIEDGAVIKRNTASLYGGGIHVSDISTGNSTVNHLYIKDGTIGGTTDDDANTASYYGAGVSLYKNISSTDYKSGEIEMTGGIISHNILTATTSNSSYTNSGGAGIYIGDTATGRIKGGKIEYNSAGIFNGGGIFNYGTLTVENGTDSNNQETIPEFTANTAKNGGAIYNTENLTISNGTIGGSNGLQNTATESGGAIYQGGTFNLKGNAKIFTGSVNVNDVYLSSNSCVVNLTGDIGSNGNTSTDPITITHATWDRGKNIVTGSSYINDNIAKFSLSDSEFELIKDGTSTFSAKLDAPIYVAGSNSVTVGGVTYGAGKTPINGGRGTKAKPYSTIADAVSQCWNGPNDTVVIDTDDEDILVGRKINIVGTVSGAQQIGNGITTAKASAITLTGVSGTTPTLHGGFTNGSKGRTLTLGTSLPVIIQSLKITGGYADGIGGGIYTTADLTIAEGAEISGNYATAGGGGIYGQGTLIIKGGTISSNHALDSNSGGGIYTNSTVEMSAGTVSGNTAGGYGGGMYARTLELSGGTISGNSAVSGGGGVYSIDVTMTGGTISGNSVTTESESQGYGGGGIFIDNDGSFIMEGGAISGNSAEKNGGGVYLYDATFLMLGSAVIGAPSGDTSEGATTLYAKDEDYCSNYAGAKGGGIYAAVDSTVGIGFSNSDNYASTRPSYSFTGGIYYNFAEEDGGGIYKVNGLFKMGYGNIQYNGAARGGGVYTQGGLTMAGGNIHTNYAKATTDDTCGGGGVYSEGSVTMYGTNPYWARIINNVAEKNGGGLYLDDTSLYLTQNAVIGDESCERYASATSNSNCANNNGGGVYITGNGNICMGYASEDDKANATVTDTQYGGISGNYAAVNGGGIYNASNNTITLGTGDSRLQYNGARRDGGGVYSETGNVTLVSGSYPNDTVYNNHADNNGGGIYTCATIEMKGGGVNKNSASQNGGGIYLGYSSAAPKIYITGGLIGTTEGTGAAKSDPTKCGNYAKNGGGIYGDRAEIYIGYNSSGNAEGELSLNRVVRNFASESGGGICIKGDRNKTAVLKIQNGKVDYNGVDGGEASSKGAGIYVFQCNVTLETGTSVSYNEASLDNGYGGGIYIEYGSYTPYPNFNMNAGSINYNKASQGGGIRHYDTHVTVNITGGEIKNNESTGLGGGLYVGGNVTISGAVDVIENKSTDDKGGAAAIIGGQTLTLQGNVNISGSNSQGMNDIFFAASNPRLKLIGLLGAVNGTSKIIYLSGQDENFYNYGKTSAYVTGDTSLNHSKFKVLPDGSGNTYTLNGSGLLVQD